jgi:hypothetical protein
MGRKEIWEERSNGRKEMKLYTIQGNSVFLGAAEGAAKKYFCEFLCFLWVVV